MEELKFKHLHKVFVILLFFWNSKKYVVICWHVCLLLHPLLLSLREQDVYFKLWLQVDQADFTH